MHNTKVKNVTFRGQQYFLTPVSIARTILGIEDAGLLVHPDHYDHTLKGPKADSLLKHISGQLPSGSIMSVANGQIIRNGEILGSTSELQDAPVA